MVINLDIHADQLVFDEKLGAKGSFAAWLGKYPTGDATALGRARIGGVQAARGGGAGEARAGTGLA